MIEKFVFTAWDCSATLQPIAANKAASALINLGTLLSLNGGVAQEASSRDLA